MTEIKIVMDEYSNLFAVLPSDDMRKIVADVYGNPYYGMVRTVGTCKTIEENTK